jgi:hypothetical protein
MMRSMLRRHLPQDDTPESTVTKQSKNRIDTSLTTPQTLFHSALIVATRES